MKNCTPSSRSRLKLITFLTIFMAIIARSTVCALAMDEKTEAEPETLQAEQIEGGRYYIFSSSEGASLLPDEIISSHNVGHNVAMDCNFLCYEEPKCVAFNFRIRNNDKYAVNCQLSSSTKKKSEIVGEWTFFHDADVESVPVPNPQTPRSCLDHMKNGLKTNGYYSIYDASSNLITVYCDMTSEPGKAWTLVTSFATRNKDMTEFETKPFYVNAPVDESMPNWNIYRMSLAHMNDISNQSTHWRATCSFPTHGVDYVDYVRGTFAYFDMINFKDRNVCKRVEYGNIRGHNCSNCTLPWWQGTTYSLHTDSTYTSCDLDPTPGVFIDRNGKGEDNFGFYRTVNPNFRCTANPSATTNWWFGGNDA